MTEPIQNFDFVHMPISADGYRHSYSALNSGTQSLLRVFRLRIVNRLSSHFAGLRSKRTAIPNILFGWGWKIEQHESILIL